jgi:hypothetical protein
MISYFTDNATIDELKKLNRRSGPPSLNNEIQFEGKGLKVTSAI